MTKTFKCPACGGDKIRRFKVTVKKGDKKGEIIDACKRESCQKTIRLGKL